MPSFIRLLFCFLSIVAPFASALSSNSTILVFARDNGAAYSATSGFRAYGIPYELVIVPQTGVALPQLQSSDNITGYYGGFLILSEVAYSYSSYWGSALTTTQFNQIYDYQTKFGARLVRLDVYPEPTFGVTTQIPGWGCCGSDEEQLISISDDSKFPTANIKVGATMSTSGLYHYPATIIDSGSTIEIAQFAASSKGTFPNKSTAAVINTFGTRQQMVWFTSWATDWSPTSTFLQHAYINWLTRGLFIGRRRIYLNTQIDDVGLSTSIYYPGNTTFRSRPADLEAHVRWTKSINSRMPAGSDYFIELGHNGNGNVISSVAVNTAKNGSTCDPDKPIYHADNTATALEWIKPLGTGTDKWPTTPVNFSWSNDCSQLDELTNWLKDTTNRDAFSHVSHTFAHLDLNNATYADVDREISFNIQWFKQTGLWDGKRFSAGGLIPPQITGIHNGDALQAWSNNGITAVVGDNTRPVLMNPDNEYWPLISTTASNGFAGMAIVPRWATTIYYNCDFANCTTQEWIDTSGGSGDFKNLLANALQVNTRHLLGLHQDPYMFHQANLRYTDSDTFTIGNQTAKMSLLMAWTETIVQEMTRLTNWPIVTLKHDDIAKAFVDRMTLDKCQPRIAWTYGGNGTTITGVTVGAASDNKCSVPVPVTFPGTASTTVSGVKHEQLGSDPLTIWTTLNGCPVTYILDTPVKLTA